MEIFDEIKQRLSRPDAGFSSLYRRVHSQLRTAIEDGRLDAGAALPSERVLAEMLDVSRDTIRNALRGLIDDGLLETRRGAGTFVRPRFHMHLGALKGFFADMQQRGLSAETRIPDIHEGLATPTERQKLELDLSGKVTRLYRLRLVDGRPLNVELAVLPADILPADEAFGPSLYAYLERKGRRPMRAIQTLKVQLLEQEQALRLGVKAGEAGFYVERQSFDAEGAPVEFVRSHYRADAYDFVAELSIQDS